MRKVAAALWQGLGRLAQGPTEDVDETVPLRTGPAQADAQLKLDGVDLFLARQLRQSPDREPFVLGETGAEDLHEVVFCCGRVAATERHVEPGGRPGGLKRQQLFGHKSAANSWRALAGGHQPGPVLFEADPQVAHRLDHVPAVDKKYLGRAVHGHQVRHQLEQGDGKPGRIGAHSTDPIEINFVPVERLINERIATRPGGQLPGQPGRVQIVDLDTVLNGRVTRPASAVWSHQHDGRLALDILHPVRQAGHKRKRHAPQYTRFRYNRKALVGRGRGRVGVSARAFGIDQLLQLCNAVAAGRLTGRRHVVGDAL